MNNFIKEIIINKYIILFIIISILISLKNYYLLHIENNDFNINEINNYEDKLLYLNNRTEFFLKKRIKFLSQYNISYNESNLITFQEKVNWLIIHESPKYKSNIVDKIKLHDYSKKILGKDICVPILKVYDDANEINYDELPEKFILKLNHGSSMNLVCQNKSKFNYTKASKILNNWKKINYGLTTKEFQYMYVNRKIFAEEFLSNDLIDYKIFCFNGEPKFIKTRKQLRDPNDTKLHNYYDLDWKLIDLETDMKGYIRDPKIKIKKPENLKLMLNYAKLLSDEFVFVRIDFYEYNNTIYLGELTFSPDNSFLTWKNKTQNITIGNLMDISKIKSYLYNH